MQRTHALLGPSNLAQRFSPQHPLGSTVLQISAAHFSKIVDYARRTVTMPSWITVHRPVVEASERAAFEQALKTYSTEKTGRTFQMFVRDLCNGGGGTHTFEVEACTTVREFKTMIKDRLSTDEREQRFIYGGKHLEDGGTMADYNIQELSTVTLMLKLSGAHEVKQERLEEEGQVLGEYS
ncbi:unnamed protein product [Vitrella brassicaformis CCMP3155]|uniref:Ubiquitin-like domain-containing protein n=2 Tax=Vitrella brassicaformis TaxID=1169539 RepID=A0A0G4EJI2_VITBC|nr:unnamed protein product [Vitrella brassicaformis CCMP3155]|eukprot:CEL96910.1 unnamed protein product [Vitrella brassicaformis CCMP3155]